LSINRRMTVVIPFTKRRAPKGLNESIFFRKAVQLYTEVLGITLDKGLTWGVQLDKVTNGVWPGGWPL